MNNSHLSDKTSIASEGVKHGGDDFTKAIELLTGRSVETINTRKTGTNPLAWISSSNPFLAALKGTKEEGRTALAGIREAPKEGIYAGMFHRNHAYLVEDFNTDTITLRDPLAGPDRVLPPLTWEDFNASFSMLLVETKNVAK